MQRPSRPTLRPVSMSALRLLAMAWIATAIVGAHDASAQQSPYYLQVSEALTYDTNLFRVSPEVGERSNLLSSTGLTVGLDQPIGRQRVYGTAGLNANVYSVDSSLNNVAYNLALGLDWEAASKLSGSVRLGATQAQADFASYGLQNQASTVRNLERGNTVDLRGQYGGTSILTLEALANYTDIKYSAEQFSANDRNSRMFGAGLRYRPTGFWVFGLIGRRTHGDQFVVVSNSNVRDPYDRTDVDLTAQFQPTGASSFVARLTHSNENHDLDTSRDFSGLTGELRWDYQATGKLRFGLNLARETGAGSSTYTVIPPAAGAPPGNTPTTSYLTNSQLSNRFGLQASWAATGKVTFGANVDRTRDRFDTLAAGSSGATVTGQRATTKGYGLSASYAATRVWNFQCSIARADRNSDATVGASSFDYKATTTSCVATLALR